MAAVIVKKWPARERRNRTQVEGFFPWGKGNKGMDKRE